MPHKTRALGGLLAATVVLLAGSLTIAAPASAASLTEVTNFGPNPTNLRMHLYVPDSVAPQPAVLLAVHYCTGSGEAGTASTSPPRRRCSRAAGATRSAWSRWSGTCCRTTTLTRAGSSSPASPQAR